MGLRRVWFVGATHFCLTGVRLLIQIHARVSTAIDNADNNSYHHSIFRILSIFSIPTSVKNDDLTPSKTLPVCGHYVASLGKTHNTTPHHTPYLLIPSTITHHTTHHLTQLYILYHLTYLTITHHHTNHYI